MLQLSRTPVSREKRVMGQAEGPPGRFSPMMQQQQLPKAQAGTGVGGTDVRSEAEAEGTGGGGRSTGGKGGKKLSLFWQALPIYAFGIILYIVYILFKITSKSNDAKRDSGFSAPKSEELKRKINDYELVQLQEKLRRTEEAMERLVSGVSHSPDSADPVWEERLIWSLSELSRAPRQGPDAQGSSPEMEAEEWGGYLEQALSDLRKPCSPAQKPDRQPTSAEEMAERVELGAELTSTWDLEQEKEEKREEGEGEEREGEGEGEERHYRGGQCIGVFQYLGESANNNSEEEEDGEEDPLVKAESLRFDCSVCYNLEEQKEQPDTEEQEQECDSEEVEELRDPEEQEDFDEQEDEWDTVRQEESEEEELFLTVEHMENSCVGWVEPMSGTLRQRRRTEAS